MAEEMNENVKAEDVKEEIVPDQSQVAEEVSAGEAVEAEEVKTASEEAKTDEEDAKKDLEDAENAVDEMEKETIYKLEVLREANNEENEEIVNEAEKKIREIFADLRQWIKTNSEPQRVKENLTYAKDQAIQVLNNTKEKVIEVSNSEDFKKAVGGIKDFVEGTGSLIADGLQFGKEQLCKNPAIKDVFDNVDAGIDKIRENPTLHNAIDKAQDVTESITGSIFSGLKSFFDGKPKTEAASEKKEAEKPAEEAEDSKE